MLLRVLCLASLWAFCGCDRSGSASHLTTSAVTDTLADRVAFVERVVPFRRSYETLDYAATFQDYSGGWVPGPSDWELRLVATVPADGLDAWVPAGASIGSAGPPSWLEEVPTAVPTGGITEWYDNGSQQVGLDRENRVVAYRLATK